jgi:serine-type D-Ala-D-Ala carboxypeptidase (penicillin-binding protein 5/6)
VYRARRRRLLRRAVLALLLCAAAFAATRKLINATPSLPQNAGVLASRSGAANTDRTFLSSVTWPQQGQAALVLGDDRAASPHEEPVPIASLAKVMTAYLVLERYPLRDAQEGFTVTVTPAEAQAEAEDAAEDQSDVAVTTGEQLTERQLLEALLVPSANNIAQILATEVAGSETSFVSEMNVQAHELGMDHTIYTDPSGFEPSTASTAADQLRVFRRAMRFAVFRQIVSMPSVTLPVAGTLANFNPLIGEGYSGKTGSDSAAGGCLAFFAHLTVGGRRRTTIGVVLGQGQGSNTPALLAAAAAAAQQLVASVVPTTRVRTPTVPGAAAGEFGQPPAVPGRYPRLRVHRRRFARVDVPQPPSTGES